jgi:hypothetical protein
VNLRLCALFASTLLSGCVFTDPSNETGGEFLDAHGVSVLASDARGFALKTLSVESLPAEGVNGAHGTEDAALGSLGRDSLRLVIGFNLADTTVMSDNLRRQNDTLTRLRLITLDDMPSMDVRARFVIVHDSLLLPGLLAGLEPSVLVADGLSLDSLVDTTFALPALDTVGDTASLVLPGAIVAKVQAIVAKRAAQSWLAVILDSRTGTDQRIQFNGLALLDRPSVSSTDTAGTLGVGTYGGNRTWQTTGFQPSGAAAFVGWGPSGGRGFRVRLDAAALRAAMYSSFGVVPDTSGGYDNTFNVLQARISAPFSSVAADVGPRSVTISSVAIQDSFANRIVPVSVPSKGSNTGAIALTSEQKRICGLTVDPILTFYALPGGLQMELKIENVLAVLPTRYSLAQGSTSSATLERSFLPIGDSVEFRIYEQIRVRVKAVSATRAEIRTWFLEQSPVVDAQYGTEDSLRTEAQLAKGGSAKLVQEVRSPLTQLLNRASKQVEFDLSPVATSDHSSRFVAIPTDPAKIFDSVKVVVRPLLSRNN